MLLGFILVVLGGGFYGLVLYLDRLFSVFIVYLSLVCFVFVEGASGSRLYF